MKLRSRRNKENKQKLIVVCHHDQEEGRLQTMLVMKLTIKLAAHALGFQMMMKVWLGNEWVMISCNRWIHEDCIDPANVSDEPSKVCLMFR